MYTRAHSDSRTRVPHDSLGLRVPEGLQTAPPSEEAKGNSPGGEGCKANNEQTCFRVDLGMRSW